MFDTFGVRVPEEAAFASLLYGRCVRRFDQNQPFLGSSLLPQESHSTSHLYDLARRI